MSTTPLNASAHDSHGADEQPWQFRVRTFLVVLALLSVLCAVLRSIGMIWSVLVVWTLLLIAAHVIANFWGTRQRRRRALNQATIDIASKREQLDDAFKERLAPATRLRKSTRTGWLTIVCTGMGAAIGGTLGTLALALLYFGIVGVGAVALGGVSAAVIGGFTGFLLATFIGISARAWHEADCHSRQ